MDLLYLKGIFGYVQSHHFLRPFGLGIVAKRHTRLHYPFRACKKISFKIPLLGLTRLISRVFAK